MSVAQNFEQLLTNFFSLYHPRQVQKVDIIVQSFKGQEVEVMKSLCDKYKKAYKVVPGLVQALEAPAPKPAVEAIEEPQNINEDSEEENILTESTPEENEAIAEKESSIEDDEDLGLDEFEKKD